MAVQPQGLKPWLCISQLKEAPPDIRSCPPATDLKINLTRKRSSQHWGRQLPPKMPDQDFIVSPRTWNTFFLSFSPLLWHWPEDTTPSSVPPRPLLRVVIQMTDLPWCSCLSFSQQIQPPLYCVRLPNPASRQILERILHPGYVQRLTGNITRIKLLVWFSDP